MKVKVAGDRLFTVVALVLSGIYGYFAFFDLSAPIQYDPLGPEGWPRVLTVTALVLCLALLRSPGERVFAASGATIGRVSLAALMLAGYAIVFEWLGFALSTSMFSAAMARLLGATAVRAIAFGVIAGVGLYAVAVHLFGLNLPAGTVVTIVTGSP